MTSLSSIAERAERGVDAYALLYDAWLKIHGEVARLSGGTSAEGQRFRRMIDAGAYLDAAMMLLPEGFSVSISDISSPWFHVSVMKKNAENYREAFACKPTPAMALLAAICKARGDGE